MTDKSYTEAMAEVGAQMAELRGELKEGLANVKGSIEALAITVETGNQARINESAELRKDVDDHEARIRSLEARRTITPRELWSVVSGVAALAIAAVAIFI